MSADRSMCMHALWDEPAVLTYTANVSLQWEHMYMFYCSLHQCTVPMYSSMYCTYVLIRVLYLCTHPCTVPMYSSVYCTYVLIHVLYLCTHPCTVPMYSSMYCTYVLIHVLYLCTHPCTVPMYVLIHVLYLCTHPCTVLQVCTVSSSHFNFRTIIEHLHLFLNVI